MSDSTPGPDSGAEDAERARIKELWQSLVTRRQGSYVDIHEELHLLANDTIRAFGEQENALRMINQLPTELFTHVASFLGQRTLWRATLVCRSWRYRLLGYPRLWMRICVSQRNCAARWSRRSSALLETMFVRSQSLPLSVEFRCMDEDDDEEEDDQEDYDNVADLIAAEMHRVRSLSLVLPDVRGTAFEDVLGRPAPVLVCFRLYVIHGSEYMRDLLFAEHAPLLTNLALSMVDFNPTANYVAVQGVTHFAYDASVLVPEDVDVFSRFFPALQSLTLSAEECEVDELTAVCTHTLALRLSNIVDILPVFNVFPNATSFCLSSATEFSNWALQALFETVDHPTSIDLDYGTFRMVDPKALYEPDEFVIGIKLDGMDVAVDLGSDETRAALDLLFVRLQRVQHLAINEDLWALFGPQLAISSVRELTVYLQPPPVGEATWRAAGLLVDRADLDGTTVHFSKFKLSLLRLVAPPNVLMPGLKESVVANVVRTVTDPSTLHTLVFCGVDLVLQSPGRLRSLVPHLNIVSEHRPISPEAQPWFWTFPADDAIRV